MAAVFPIHIVYGQSPESSRQWKTDRVTVTVDIQANIYTYHMVNHSIFPLVSFKIPYCASYNFLVPEKWEHDTSNNIFSAHAAHPIDGIAKNKTGTFSLRVSSKGSVLGQTPLELAFSDDYKIIIPDVWSPVSESAGYRLLLALAVIVVLGLHTLMVIRRRKRTSIV